MEYFVYLQTGCAVDAESEKEAKTKAMNWFAAQLLRGDIELHVETEESEDD